MKKVTKKATAVLLTMILAILSVIPAFGATMNEPQTRIEDGVEFVAFRQAAEYHNMQVAWDGPNQTVIVTDQYGVVRYVVVYEVGGFNDKGTVWVPLDFVLAFFYITGDDELVDVDDEPVDDEPDIPWPLSRPPLVRTTDHGEMAVAFITEMNDNLYNRVPFTYRELEAANWIAYELAAMGFGEDAIEIQSFYMDDVEDFLLAFGNDWFVDAVRRRANGEVLGDEFMETHLETYVETFYPLFVADFAGMGVPYEMIAEVLGVDLVEFLEMQFAFMTYVYGIFSEDAEFRPYSQNVILTIPGQSEQTIVLTAHYDTIYHVAGASDNASGVALLMESAYRMMDEDNYYTLVYVFAGAEETGLVGTFYYYMNLTPAQQANILLNINADLLFEGPYFLFGTAQLDPAMLDTPQLEIMLQLMAGYGFMDNDITRYIGQISEELNEEYGTQLINLQHIAAMPSDQLVFAINGHTVVMLTGFARHGDEAYEGFSFAVVPIVFYRGFGFGATIYHAPYDNVHFINENWPDKIADAMWTFSMFLDALLAARF